MRRLLVGLSFLFMSIIFTGCDSSVDITTKVPNLNITFNNEDVTVIRGGFEWTDKVNLFETQSVIADAASPDQIAKDLNGFSVPPGTNLNLKFTKQPSNIEVISWSGNKSESYEVENNTITIPEKNGIYAYEIIGTWKGGKVSYTTKIIVDSDILKAEYIKAVVIEEYSYDEDRTFESKKLVNNTKINNIGEVEEFTKTFNLKVKQLEIYDVAPMDYKIIIQMNDGTKNEYDMSINEENTFIHQNGTGWIINNVDYKLYYYK